MSQFPPEDTKSKNLDKGETTGTPRWVSVFGIIIGVLVLLVLILKLFGGGNHGPGRHMSDHSSDQTILHNKVQHL
ncbi:hypothetical protein [Mesobacillus foraminis]|uniref:hypothetical protein n=1 Tax=Mesobacillus foraminis TaxID=279826 RepID=UPI001BE9C011|nr:hypothetical protein [Mesobacillus foraminis]